jgi:hypothetical protein
MSPMQGPVLASMAGSELPWWTPIAVCAALLLVALVYRRRHRPGPPASDLSGTTPPIEGPEPAEPVSPPITPRVPRSDTAFRLAYAPRP